MSNKNRKITLEALTNKFEVATELFFNLGEDEKTVHKKMLHLTKFRDEFDADLENIDNERSGI